MAKDDKTKGKGAAAPAAGSKDGKKAEEKPAGPKMLGSKEVADLLGIKPATLRRYLRSKGRGTTDDQTRYEWPEGKDGALSKEVKQLKLDYENYKEEQAAKAKERGEALAKGGKKKDAGKKKGKQAEEDTEDVEEEEEAEEI